MDSETKTEIDFIAIVLLVISIITFIVTYYNSYGKYIIYPREGIILSSIDIGIHIIAVIVEALL